MIPYMLTTGQVGLTVIYIPFFRATTTKYNSYQQIKG